jgi:iron complex outermembrane receptor protein
VNVVPKRAGEEPLIAFTPDYSSDSEFGGHIDVGRRFGKDKEFGVRFNGVFRDGDTAVDNQSRESRLAALGLDYRGDRVRLSSDLGYQEQDIQGTRSAIQVASGVDVPKAPDNRSNIVPWAFSNPEVFYGTVRGEFDITEDITAFAAIGGSRRRQQAIVVNRTVIDAQGTLAAGNTSPLGRKVEAYTYEAGLRGAVETGPVHHQAVLAHTRFAREERLQVASFAFPATNLYDPTYNSGPSSSLIPDPDDAPKSSEGTLSSTALADTLSILDERIQLTFGVRFQRLESTNYNRTTGAVTSTYGDSAITPAVGLVIKPWRNVSLYANYIEGLEEGDTAPTGAANAGEVFAPYITKQYEAGAKVDFGRFTTTISAYQIAQPSTFTDPGSNVFTVDGEQRNRGLEFNVFGEAADGLRLLGGVSYIDSELTKTAGGVNDGNNGIGVPDISLILAGEWDTPFFKGLTLSGRVTHNGSFYRNAANTQKAPAWTQLDIGASYAIERSNHSPIIVRASVENVFDADFWTTADNGGSLILSDPRTFKLSATFSF